MTMRACLSAAGTPVHGDREDIGTSEIEGVVRVALAHGHVELLVEREGPGARVGRGAGGGVAELERAHERGREQRPVIIALFAFVPEHRDTIQGELDGDRRTEAPWAQADRQFEALSVRLGVVTPAEASGPAARPPELSDPEPGVELCQSRPAHAEHGSAAQPQAGVSGGLRLDRGDPS